MSGAGGGVGSPFSGFQSCQGNTLNPGDSCQMVYSFSPTSAGAASTNSIGDWNGQNFNVTLSGTVESPGFLIALPTLAFGRAQVRSTAPSQTVIVTNIGLSPAVMSGAGGGVGSPFSGFQGCHGKTLNPGASCQMAYSFSPTPAGAASTTSTRHRNRQNFNITLTATSPR